MPALPRISGTAATLLWAETGSKMSTRETDFETLAAYVLGELDRPMAAELEAGLAQSPADAALVGRIREVVDILRTDDTVAPQRALVERVKRLFETPRPATVAGILERAREVVATLVFDSRVRTAMAGFRGPASSYQLAFSSDLADVDLQIAPPGAPHESLWTLRGQVSPHDRASVSSVALIDAGTSSPVATTPVDERGMFSMKSGPGAFDLRIAMGDGVLTVPSIQVE